MTNNIENWKTQVRKGYLELCILLLILKHKRVYGFDLLEKLENSSLPLKEGTLYPMLNRMTVEGTLSATWDTENAKGHPRKFYSITAHGESQLRDMNAEFQKMIEVYKKINE